MELQGMAYKKLGARERDYFLAHVSELAYASLADANFVQSTLQTTYGLEWTVKPITFAIPNSPVQNLQYLLVFSNVTRELSIVFKGSDGSLSEDAYQDWMWNNLNACMGDPNWAPYKGASKVHTGFSQGWTNARSSVLQTISYIISESSDSETQTFYPWTVYVAGHSLGGALAQLCFSELLHLRSAGVAAGFPALSQISELFIATFAAPLVGDSNFSNLFASLVIQAQNDGCIVDGNIYETKNEFVGMGYINNAMMCAGYEPLQFSVSLNYEHPQLIGHSIGTYVGCLKKLFEDESGPDQPLPPAIGKVLITLAPRFTSTTAPCVVKMSVADFDGANKTHKIEIARANLQPSTTMFHLSGLYSVTSETIKVINIELESDPANPIKDEQFQALFFENVIYSNYREIARPQVIALDYFDRQFSSSVVLRGSLPSP